MMMFCHGFFVCDIPWFWFLGIFRGLLYYAFSWWFYLHYFRIDDDTRFWADDFDFILYLYRCRGFWCLPDNTSYLSHSFGCPGARPILPTTSNKWQFQCRYVSRHFHIYFAARIYTERAAWFTLGLADWPLRVNFGSHRRPLTSPRLARTSHGQCTGLHDTSWLRISSLSLQLKQVLVYRLLTFRFLTVLISISRIISHALTRRIIAFSLTRFAFTAASCLMHRRECLRYEFWHHDWYFAYAWGHIRLHWLSLLYMTRWYRR
jgi:hypothetical protein